MPRQARLDARGTLHHVMLRGIERRAIVTDDADRHQFVRRLGALAMQSRTSVYGWALLTNHAHLLLRSGPDGLPRLMRRFLTGYAQSLQPAPPASRSPVSESLQVHCVRGGPLFCGVTPLHPSQSLACQAGQDFNPSLTRLPSTRLLSIGYKGRNAQVALQTR